MDYTTTSMSRDQARRIMAAFPTGVAVVTARDSGASVGVTVNSLTSVSLQPPTILVSLENGLHTLAVIRRTGRFGVNLLSRHQSEVATHFAAHKEKKFLDIAHHHPVDEVPVLDDRMAHAVCEVSTLSSSMTTPWCSELCCTATAKALTRSSTSVAPTVEWHRADPVAVRSSSDGGARCRHAASHDFA